MTSYDPNIKKKFILHKRIADQTCWQNNDPYDKGILTKNLRHETQRKGIKKRKVHTQIKIQNWPFEKKGKKTKIILKLAGQCGHEAVRKFPYGFIRNQTFFRHWKGIRFSSLFWTSADHSFLFLYFLLQTNFTLFFKAIFFFFWFYRMEKRKLLISRLFLYFLNFWIFFCIFFQFFF